MANTDVLVEMPTEPEESAVQSDGQGESGAKREQSTISFPYNDLDDAVELAQAIHAFGGSSCETGQLAAQLQMTVTGGGFRLRLLAAKTFGFVTYSQGTVSLTNLGSQVCDPQQERVARRDGFLKVPLYRQVYEKFKNGTLPPNAALDREIMAMGVITKQADKARQVLLRSAGQANFFWSGQDRLVMPPQGGRTEVGAQDPPPPKLTDGKTNDGNGVGSGGGGGEYHPFIMGLLKTLPTADSDWPMDSRRKWLQAASHIFEVIYKDSDSKGSLRIEVQKDSAK